MTAMATNAKARMVKMVKMVKMVMRVPLLEILSQHPVRGCEGGGT